MTAAEIATEAYPGPVTQQWTWELPMMQQTVLLTAIRGPDGLPKYSPAKYLLRWFRRCVLLSAMDRRVIRTADDPGGGSFTGPCEDLDSRAGDYLRDVDAIPHHFQLHFMHAAEILGYKHPDEGTRAWWRGFYVRLVQDMHLHPETEAEMDARLGDDREGWLARADPATVD